MKRQNESNKVHPNSLNTVKAEAAEGKYERLLNDEWNKEKQTVQKEDKICERDQKNE